MWIDWCMFKKSNDNMLHFVDIEIYIISKRYFNSKLSNTLALLMKTCYMQYHIYV